MRFPFLCELQSVSSEDVSFIKWIAITAMIVSLFVGILWAITLIKDLGSDRASKHDLTKLNERLNAVEAVLEERVKSVYTKIEHQAELSAKALADESVRVSTTLMSIMKDLGQALAAGTKGGK